MWCPSVRKARASSGLGKPKYCCLLLSSGVAVIVPARILRNTSIISRAPAANVAIQERSIAPRGAEVVLAKSRATDALDVDDGPRAGVVARHDAQHNTVQRGCDARCPRWPPGPGRICAPTRRTTVVLAKRADATWDASLRPVWKVLEHRRADVIVCHVDCLRAERRLPRSRACGKTSYARRLI